MRRLLLLLACLAACASPAAPFCGDGVCDHASGEFGTCNADCPPVCGDYYCDGPRGENTWTCDVDCPSRCGDGHCDTWEFCATCPDDCSCAHAATPPMGWNSWNRFQCNVDEDLIAATADVMAREMSAAGYRFINIDDCWQASRDANGQIVADPKTFPGGIAALAQKVNDNGLQFGVYTCAGDKTCAGRPGSRDHEAQDMKTYADWGVDYVKVDWCFTDGLDARTQYGKFHDGIVQSGRDIVLSLCNWGVQDPWVWGAGAGQLWRTSGDISDGFISMYLNLTAVSSRAAYAGPGHWNDPDMLEVGNGHMTDDEYRSHMSLWAILSAPLIAGCDLRTQESATREILLNEDVIAIDQDPLGLQGQRVVEASDTTAEVWAKPLMRPGYRAVLVFNPADVTVTMAIDAIDFGLAPGVAQAWDLWAPSTPPTPLDKLGPLTIAPHASRFFGLMGQEPLPPSGSTPLCALRWTYVASAQGGLAKDHNHDGGPIALRGQIAKTGVGALAGSIIVVPLGGKCSRFTAKVGIDDAAGGKGSSAFEVWVDGVKRWQSGVLTGADQAVAIDEDLRDAVSLKLVTTAGNDSEAGDLADWADAFLTCK